MPQLISTLGEISDDTLAIILPHEHVFVDLRTWDVPGYAQANTQDVINLMVPELHRARKAGISLIIECSPVGVGRRADILLAVSKAADFPLVVPTGVYREPWIPPWVHTATETILTNWMYKELTESIDNAPVRAGFIKLSAGDDGITETEKKVLRSAVRAAKPVGAAIASHTIRTRVVRDQLTIIEGLGYSAERFVWVHASAEDDVAGNIEIARRGAWIEYDFIGGGEQSDEYLIERIQRMLNAGLGHRLLLSQDRGWYDPAQPRGGTPMPYTYITDTFLPKLREAGLQDTEIHTLTHRNPLLAFGRN